MMKASTLFRSLIVILIVAFLSGCEKKKETPEEKPAEKPRAVQQDTVAKEVSKAPEVVIPDLTGTWTGKFDNHATTLKITKQDSTKFSGAISIAYREAINQQVSGKIDVDKNRVTMSDQLHSRYAGSYVANLSEDGKSLSGTFTQNVDKTKFNFNLKKK